MRVVEADQPGTVRRVQRERIRQAVWSLLGCLDALDLKLEPVAFFKMMDAPIEREQELEPVLGFTSLQIISSYSMRLAQWTRRM
jgi:hypothetical protein